MSKKRRRRTIILVTVLGALIALMFVILFSIGPEGLVRVIGIRNGYLLALFTAFFGGYSSGGSVALISVLITLVVGGLSPFYLGLIAGSALALGDAIMFYFAAKSRELVDGKWDKRIKRFSKTFEENKVLNRSMPFLAYIYLAFAPLPNDILLLFLAAVDFPKKLMIKIIILGDVTFAFSVVYLGVKSISFF